jgi:hypothetical protein
VNKCRYCGYNWVPGHKCINKKLYTCKVEKESDSSSSESKRENKKKKNCRKCGKNGQQGTDVRTSHIDVHVKIDKRFLLFWWIFMKIGFPHA